QLVSHSPLLRQQQEINDLTQYSRDSSVNWPKVSGIAGVADSE
ncbi:5733_t:CDS:1, partial [Acaulospora morrowiae]